MRITFKELVEMSSHAKRAETLSGRIISIDGRPPKLENDMVKYAELRVDGWYYATISPLEYCEVEFINYDEQMTAIHDKAIELEIFIGNHESV